MSKLFIGGLSWHTTTDVVSLAPSPRHLLGSLVRFLRVPDTRDDAGRTSWRHVQSIHQRPCLAYRRSHTLRQSGGHILSLWKTCNTMSKLFIGGLAWHTDDARSGPESRLCSPSS
ncbi:uncharacterized protein BDZ99DRAFT_518078 [Mytilinidion resinicola]|uniref:Uncharacterized protein n=1 Tax=Mytilinidion resinicola TaxID=574789 RepID=A0A6A6YV17_9PEZI|nr:uncharacterized protein BDZ99DRAFT_518078 [Mytilinidion resinicola]KAF2812223.1 hypothetical protein BDZ99DRAFT_518078 [Mytilinidion resinicola]